MGKVKLYINPQKKDLARFRARYPSISPVVMQKIEGDTIRVEIHRHETYVFLAFHIPEYVVKSKSIESVEINIFYDRKINDAYLFAFNTSNVVKKYESQIRSITCTSFGKFLESILSILLEDEARIIEHILMDTRDVKEEYRSSRDSSLLIRHLTNNLNNISTLKLIYDNQDQLLDKTEEYIRNYENSSISYQRIYISQELTFAKDFCQTLMHSINTKYQVRMTDIMYVYTRYTFVIFLTGAVFEIVYGFVNDPSPIKLTFWLAGLTILAGSLIMLKKF